MILDRLSWIKPYKSLKLCINCVCHCENWNHSTTGFNKDTRKTVAGCERELLNIISELLYHCIAHDCAVLHTSIPALCLLLGSYRQNLCWNAKPWLKLSRCLQLEFEKNVMLTLMIQSLSYFRFGSVCPHKCNHSWLAGMFTVTSKPLTILQTIHTPAVRSYPFQPMLK